MFGRKKINIGIMDSSWNIMVENVKVTNIPRIDELIYLELDEQYYQVKTVVHNIHKNQDIFVIVEKFLK